MKEEGAELVSRETGKPVSAAAAEIEASAKLVEYAEEPRRKLRAIVEQRRQRVAADRVCYLVFTLLESRSRLSDARYVCTIFFISKLIRCIQCQ